MVFLLKMKRIPLHAWCVPSDLKQKMEHIFSPLSIIVCVGTRSQLIPEEIPESWEASIQDDLQFVTTLMFFNWTTLLDGLGKREHHILAVCANILT